MCAAAARSPCAGRRDRGQQRREGMAGIPARRRLLLHREGAVQEQRLLQLHRRHRLLQVRRQIDRLDNERQHAKATSFPCVIVSPFGYTLHGNSFSVPPSSKQCPDCLSVPPTLFPPFVFSIGKIDPHLDQTLSNKNNQTPPSYALSRLFPLRCSQQQNDSKQQHRFCNLLCFFICPFRVSSFPEQRQF